MTTPTGDGAVVSFLESTLGLSFTGPRRERLLAAIEDGRAGAALSPQEYLAAVQRPGRTFDRLVAQVTVGETYFFRDRMQCNLLQHVVLPELAASGDARSGVALWSAGCASGEEAFTLAALADAAGLGDRWTVVGTDASSGAVEKARRAVYGEWSMRSIDPAETAAHLRQEGGRYHVVDRLREHTRFHQANLLDGPPVPGRFDVILCRNLLIYLTPDAVQRAAEVLAGALTPEGWLITAAGDPPLRAVGLRTVRTPYGLAYRRGTPDLAPAPQAPPATAAAPATALPPAAAGAAARSRPAAAAPSRVPASPTAPPAPVAPPTPLAPVAAASAAGAVPSRAPRPTARPAEPGTDSAAAQALAREVRLLGDAGRIDDACAAAAEAVREHPLDVELAYLAGVVLLEAGRLDEAATAASGAVYLGPDLAAAHVLLGQVEHARGNVDRARRCFRNGSRLLAAVPGETPVALAGDVPARHLAAVAARYLTTDGAR